MSDVVGSVQRLRVRSVLRNDKRLRFSEYILVGLGGMKSIQGPEQRYVNSSFSSSSLCGLRVDCPSSPTLTRVAFIQSEVDAPP